MFFSVGRIVDSLRLPSQALLFTAGSRAARPEPCASNQTYGLPRSSAMCSPAASNVITDLARKIRCYLRYYNKAGEADQLELSQSGASNE
jgi:hypothetical protein